MSENAQSREVRKTWELAASGWAKWESVLAARLSDVTETLVDMAGVGPGMRVLDLACGAGSQSIHAAKRVGPNGSVVACDISATMLEHVRQNADRAGVDNIVTLESAAEDIAETQIPFDASISRLGLMLFPSPRGAVQAVQRVLKPGARFAALVFTTPSGNPFMARPMAILLRHAGKAPPAPGQPGIFAMGGDRVLETLMKDSGLADVETRTVRAPFALPSAADALEMMQQAFGAYRAVVAELADADKSRAWGEVYECLKEFESTRGFETEFEFTIGSGAKQA